METLGHPPIFDQMSVLADDARSRILLVLERQELTVTEICAVMQLPQSTVSRQLKTLADGGWVASRRDGTRRLYHGTLGDLDSSSRNLWLLAREQVAGTASADQDARRLASVLAERRKRSQQFFAGAAGEWDQVREELFGHSSYLLALLDLIDPRSVVADLGCGTGAVCEALAPVTQKVFAIDDSEAMLEAARERLGVFRNVTVRLGDLQSLPLPDGAVDAATLILVLHHLPDPAAVIREVARILRPGGKLLIVDMLPHERAEYRQQMGHVWMGFSERAIRRYLSGAGLESIRFRSLPPEPAAKGPAVFAASASAAPVNRGNRSKSARNSTHPQKNDRIHSGRSSSQ